MLLETHGFKDAGVPDPLSCEVALTQINVSPEMVGKALTVMVEVLEHPILLVYVIVAIPAVTPVTRPVFETLATEVLLEVHGLVIAGNSLPDNCNVSSLHTDVLPVIVGSGLTTISMVAVFAHCPEFGVNVYLVVAVLFNAGDHVPLTELFDVNGKADKVPPEHIAATWVNVGVMGLVTFIVSVLAQPKLFR